MDSSKTLNNGNNIGSRRRKKRKNKNKKRQTSCTTYNEMPTWLEQYPSKDELNFCCYRFIDSDGNIIYVGKAENLLNRLNGHKHLPDECYHRVVRLEYCKFDSYDDLYLAEPYFIAKWKPEYNQDYKNRNYSFSIAEFETKTWKKFEGGIKIILKKH